MNQNADVMNATHAIMLGLAVAAALIVGASGAGVSGARGDAERPTLIRSVELVTNTRKDPGNHRGLFQNGCNMAPEAGFEPTTR